MKTDLIIKSLRDWSPHGLCSGKLVVANGDRRKTEACAVGCLALGFLASPAGNKWLFKRDVKNKAAVRHRFIRQNLYDRAGIVDPVFEQAMLKHYDINCEIVGEIMIYNDECEVGRQEALRHDDLPRKLTAAIHQLRKQYEKWVGAER